MEENDLYPTSEFPLINTLKPKFRLGQVLLSDTIRHSRSDDHEDFRQLPSVTKILQATMSVENRLKLQIWEEKMIAKMGREAFDNMKALTFKRGHRLHNAIGKINGNSIVGRGGINLRKPYKYRLEHIAWF